MSHFPDEANWQNVEYFFVLTLPTFADPISRALLAAPDQLLSESQASATLATAIGEFVKTKRQQRRCSKVMQAMPISIRSLRN